MKKITALLLAIVMVISLTACGNDEEPVWIEPAEETPADEITTDEITTDEITADEITAASESENHWNDIGEWPTDNLPETEFVCPDDVRAAFMALVESNDGFEIAYSRAEQNEIYAGGKDNIYWFLGRNGDGLEQLYYAEYDGHDWADFYFETADGVTTVREADVPTISMLTYFVYYGQTDIDYNPCVPVEVTDIDMVCDRYSYSFGAYAYDISREYGLTVRYSNTDRPEEGFEPVYIHTGDSVQVLQKPETVPARDN